MRILRILPSIDPANGGPVEGAIKSAELFRALGHSTTISTFDSVEARFSTPGICHAPLGRGIGKYGFNPRATTRIRDLAADHDVSIIHGLWQYHTMAAHHALVGRYPYIIFPHGMLDPWFNRTYPIKAIKKNIYWRLGDYRAIRDASAVCFTTETERLLARTSFRPYCAREFIVNYGTTAPPKLSPLHRTAFLGTCPQAQVRPYLLFLSRIQSKKGCDMLIRAFATIAHLKPSLLLIIAGPDQEGWTKELKAIAESTGIGNRILWPGMLTGDAKWGAFYGAEAFCLPSHQENFGIAVAEALACGLPVLISDQVNIWKEVTEYGAGYADRDTLDGTIKLLSRWMKTTNSERESMGKAAALTFISRFEIHRACSSLLALLEDVIKGHLPPIWSKT